MKLLLETTADWNTPTPNNVYIFDDSDMKIVGYIKAGTVDAIKFSKPMGFDKRRRTFKEVKMKGFNLAALGNTDYQLAREKQSAALSRLGAIIESWAR